MNKIKRAISRIWFVAVFIAIATTGKGQQLAFPGVDGYDKYVEEYLNSLE